MKLSEALSLIIPLAGIAISYFFGKMQSYYTYKRQRLEDGYDKFYIPFIERMNASRFWEASNVNEWNY